MNSEIEALRNALSKAVQTTANQPNSMGITYDEEIQWKTFQYAPFLTFLESKGRCQDVSTANVAFYKETPTNTAQFIAEAANIPEYTATSYEEVPDRMKTLVSGIKVSKMAQMGTDYMDVLEREIERGYLKVTNLLDKTLLDGDSTVDTNSFDKIWGDSDVNNDDLEGEAITEDAIDDMLDTIINENGGHPDVIITDSFVAKQLRAIVAPYRRYNDKIDIGLGHRVVSYESLDGIEVPILVDKNLPDESDEHKLLAVDSSTIDVKYLMRPSLVADLPANNLAYNQAVVTYVTAMNTAPFKNGIIEGIGAGE